MGLCYVYHTYRGWKHRETKHIITVGHPAHIYPSKILYDLRIGQEGLYNNGLTTYLHIRIR